MKMSCKCRLQRTCRLLSIGHQDQLATNKMNVKCQWKGAQRNQLSRTIYQLPDPPCQIVIYIWLDGALRVSVRVDISSVCTPGVPSSSNPPDLPGPRITDKLDRKMWIAFATQKGTPPECPKTPTCVKEIF